MVVKHSAEQELRHASKSRRCSGRGFAKRLVEMKILEPVLESLYINRAFFVFNILYHHVGKIELFQILENLKSENNGNVKDSSSFVLYKLHHKYFSNYFQQEPMFSLFDQMKCTIL